MTHYLLTTTGAFGVGLTTLGCLFRHLPSTLVGFAIVAAWLRRPPYRKERELGIPERNWWRSRGHRFPRREQ
jgi:hypothetical protein